MKTQPDQALKTAQINFTSSFYLLACSVLLVISTILGIYILIFSLILTALRPVERTTSTHMGFFFPFLNTA